jgi:hypothetical protein
MFEMEHAKMLDLVLQQPEMVGRHFQSPHLVAELHVADYVRSALTRIRALAHVVQDVPDLARRALPPRLAPSTDNLSPAEIGP